MPTLSVSPGSLRQGEPLTNTDTPCAGGGARGLALTWANGGAGVCECGWGWGKASCCPDRPRRREDRPGPRGTLETPRGSGDHGTVTGQTEPSPSAGPGATQTAEVGAPGPAGPGSVLGAAGSHSPGVSESTTQGDASESAGPAQHRSVCSWRSREGTRWPRSHRGFSSLRKQSCVSPPSTKRGFLAGHLLGFCPSLHRPSAPRGQGPGLSGPSR